MSNLDEETLAAPFSSGPLTVVRAVRGRIRRLRCMLPFVNPNVRLMNKRVLESLIKAGALDSLGRRSQLIAAADKAIERAQKAQRDEAAGQH